MWRIEEGRLEVLTLKNEDSNLMHGLVIFYVHACFLLFTKIHCSCLNQDVIKMSKGPLYFCIFTPNIIFPSLYFAFLDACQVINLIMFSIGRF